jgi:hypothetical protein
MFNKSLFLLFISLFLSINAHAQQSCEAAPENYKVIFGNGILTTPEGAATSRNNLRLNLGDSYNGQTITYDLAYNYSNNAFVDLIQSLDQQLTQYTSQALGWLYGVGVVPEWFNTMQQRLHNAEYQINAPELSTHVEKYKEAILQGQKVLLVSHSQGNFYANQAKQIMGSASPAVPMASFAIFGVATPANNVGGASAPYLTNHRDIILLVPGSLASNWTLRNVSNNAAADDRGRVIAHSFVDTYMNPNFDISPAVINGIKLQLSGLQDPPQVVGNGPITATMSWNIGSSDVDLHIFEPNNEHIYYAAKTGTSGYLDLDNVRGFGPEHYYTDCNQLQVGEYVFALNYYNDALDGSDSLPARPVTATITLTVPGSTRTFSKVLSEDVQSEGDSSPIKVAKITVERIVDPSNVNLNGKLKYKITGI